MDFALKKSWVLLLQWYEFSLDIDNGFAYLGKGFTRTIGGYLKSLMKFKFNEILQRTNVLLGLKSDPYDNFDYILELSKKNNLETIFFILIGNYSLFDRNISYLNTRFQDWWTINICKLSRFLNIDTLRTSSFRQLSTTGLL